MNSSLATRSNIRRMSIRAVPVLGEYANILLMCAMSIGIVPGRLVAAGGLGTAVLWCPASSGSWARCSWCSSCSRSVKAIGAALPLRSIDAPGLESVPAALTLVGVSGQRVAGVHGALRLMAATPLARFAAEAVLAALCYAMVRSLNFWWQIGKVDWSMGGRLISWEVVAFGLLMPTVHYIFRRKR